MARRHNKRLVGVTLMAGLLLTAVLVGGSMARAEDKGITLDLGYHRGYTNTGPNNAYGTAHLWPSEGVALVEVHALPRQPGGNTYAAWVVNTTTGDAMRLGAFNTTNAGDGTVDVTFNSPIPAGSNAIIITLQHPSDPIAAPTAERALAGFFAAQAPQTARNRGNNGSVATVPGGGRQTSWQVDRNGRPIVTLLPQTGGGPRARPSRRPRGPHTRS